MVINEAKILSHSTQSIKGVVRMTVHLRALNQENRGFALYTKKWEENYVWPE